MNQLTQFNGMSVSIIDHNGKKWLTAEQVGLCLGYAKANARIGISNLYSRHLDRFDENDTCVIKLITQGQQREIRIFSTTGCVTLGWLANTKRAGEFQNWAKKVLAERMEGVATSPTPAPVPATSNKKNKCVSITRAIERQVFELFVEGYSQRQIADAVSISSSAVCQLLQAKYRFPAGAGAPEADYALLTEVAGRQYDIEMERVEAMRVRIAQKFMPNANNKELEEVLEQVGQNLNCELLTGV